MEVGVENLLQGVGSWNEWSNSFDWGNESQPWQRSQAVMTAEASLDMKARTDTTYRNFSNHVLAYIGCCS